MASFALVTHPFRREAAELARDAAQWLAARGQEVRILETEAGPLGLGQHACEPSKLTPGLDLAVSLGGDGTMLRTIELVARDGVPVLGVNMGQLGYLTEVEPSDLHHALERFLDGSYSVEERMTLAVEIAHSRAMEASGAPTEADAAAAPRGRAPAGTYLGLNETVVEKRGAGHTIHMSVEIGGRFFTTYAADGLIVATPTGSTAYAFSARGPIVAPGLSALLITPVSPHMLFDRSLVLGPEDWVRIELIDDRDAVVTVDGHELGRLQRGDAAICRAGPHRARFVTFGGRDFYGILKAKFGLSDR